MYQLAKAADNYAVDLAEVRRENLRAISVKLGGAAKLAKATDRDESQISQLIGRNPTRNIGPELARRLEADLGLKPGELDRIEGHSEAVDMALDILRAMEPSEQSKAVEVLRALSKAS